MDRAAVILAAGKGTRMKSAKTKVLHEVGGRSMLDWSLHLADSLGCARRILVVGTHSQELSEIAADRVGDSNVAVQDPPMGTGHAVKCAKEALRGFQGNVVILYADTPLLPQAAIDDAFGILEKGTDIAVLGFTAREPGGYGRLIESEDGSLERIVEAKDANDEELAVDFCNSGVMAVHSTTLFRLLDLVKNDNSNGEYYLTDIVGLARDEGLTAKAVRADEDLVQGVNSRVQLAEMETVFQNLRRIDVMESGVTLIDPASVFFSHDTRIGQDVVIEPNVYFSEGVKIEANARIHANSWLEHCQVGEGADIGPFARLRKGSDIGAGARIGNFVEVKNTRLGDGAKANHLAYLGDGDVGAGANIGAGTIFCNYDGYFKHRTEVGKGAFVGSNSSLVAPVKIADNSFVGSGSVITKDVASGDLAVARGRQSMITGWATKYHAEMAEKKNNS